MLNNYYNLFKFYLKINYFLNFFIKFFYYYNIKFNNIFFILNNNNFISILVIKNIEIFCIK